ncbi:MAG TPA: glucose 1-dehydrogenase [Phycisphaerae bacterium]|nr:glucose 1-dehydrogenase [Phycisphaerae bacterium]HOI56124.1 glucose 1-dehydrogenase [Phycisphaerae bacterium]
MARLHEKTALVTGAAQGIGLAIARAFVDEGALVVLSDIQIEKGRAAAATLGERASFVSLDVRVEADWERAMASVIDRYARLDVLVNNAGITGFADCQGPHDPEHATAEAWRAVHATNLDGVFFGCKHAIQAMRPHRKGSIINLSSRSGVVGIPRAAAYASSKAAVRHHTKSVALYCAEEGLAIRCNSIQPAAILTPMWEAVLGDGQEREANLRRYAASAPLNRFGTVEEVAALAVYLASDESGFTTGAEFTIDGGMLAGVSEPPKPGAMPAPSGMRFGG